jgi:hypothetical protein
MKATTSNVLALTHHLVTYSMGRFTATRWSPYLAESQRAAHQTHGLSLEEQERICWNCNHHFQKGGIICGGCDKIQPVNSTMNYFELLGMWVSKSGQF